MADTLNLKNCKWLMISTNVVLAYCKIGEVEMMTIMHLFMRAP